MREEFVLYVFGRMLNAKVVTLVEDEKNKDFVSRVNVASKKDKPWTGVVKAIISDIKQYASHFKMTEEKADFEYSFNRYALAVLIDCKVKDVNNKPSNLVNELLPGSSFLKTKLSKIDVDAKVTPVFGDLLESSASELNKHVSEEFFYGASLKLEIKAPTKSDVFYHIARLVQVMLEGGEIEDKDNSKRCCLAKKIIDTMQFQNGCEVDKILAVVEKYIIENLNTIDTDLIENAPGLLLLGKETYYNNFKNNIAKYGRNLTDNAIVSALSSFSNIIAESVMNELSEEEIHDAFKKYCSLKNGGQIIRNVYDLLIKNVIIPTNPTEQHVTRAKIVGKCLTKFGKVETFSECLKKQFSVTWFDTLLGLIDREILDVESLSDSDLKFIAQQLNKKPEDYHAQGHGKLFKIIVSRFALFTEKIEKRDFHNNVYDECEFYYGKLVSKLVEANPSILETHRVNKFYDISKYGDYLIKNAEYLNVITNAGRHDLEKFHLPLFESKNFPPDALDKLEYKNFKNLIQTKFGYIWGECGPEEFGELRKLSFIGNFQGAIKKHFEACKKSDNYYFMIILYGLCTDESFEKVIEEELAKAQYEHLKKALSLSSKFFQKLNITKACALIKGCSFTNAWGNTRKGFEPWMENVLRKEAEYILKNKDLQDAVLTHIKSYESDEHILKQLGAEAQDKKVVFENFSKECLQLVLKSLSEKSNYFYKGAPLFRDAIARNFTAKELLDVGAIELVWSILNSNPNYIDGEHKAAIQYQFLSKNLECKVVGDDVGELAKYIKQSYKPMIKEGELATFVKQNNEAFIKVGFKPEDLDMCSLLDKENKDKLTQKRKEQKDADDIKALSVQADKKKVELRLEAARINRIRLLSGEELLKCAEADYKHLTDYQKADFLLGNVSGKSQTVEDKIKELAIDRAKPGSHALELLVTKYALYEKAITRFVWSSDNGYALPKSLEKDKNLRLIFYKGEEKFKSTLVCDVMLLAAFIGACFKFDIKYVFAAAGVILPCVNAPLVCDKISYQFKGADYMISNFSYLSSHLELPRVEENVKK